MNTYKFVMNKHKTQNTLATSLISFKNIATPTLATIRSNDISTILLAKTEAHSTFIDVYVKKKTKYTLKTNVMAKLFAYQSCTAVVSLIKHKKNKKI